MTDEPGVRAAYDSVARAYHGELRAELSRKPVDRALLVALTELAAPGPIADLGCGPGHVARFLAGYRPEVIGLDLSPRMIELARQDAPELRFEVASMLALPARDGEWAGAVALYSIIHLSADERALACRELARAVRPGGPVLIAFHVENAEVRPGGSIRLTTFFDVAVDLESYFLDPAVVRAELTAAGFTVTATLDRAPIPGAEHPSRRCYLLASRDAPE